MSYSHHHHSTLFPSLPDNNQDSAQFSANEVNEESTNTTVNIIGLFVALLVSVIIIIGVAFVIRKIRKRQDTADDEENGKPSNVKPSEVETIYKPEVHNQDVAQTFTITFTEVPKERTGIVQWIPKKLRPKPKKVDIEKLKRELGQIYVY